MVSPPFSVMTNELTEGLAVWLAAGTAFVGAAGTAGAAGGAPLTFLVQQAFGFGVGDWIKERWYPVSQKKVDSWKQSLKEDREKLEETIKTMISKQLNFIFKEISSELQAAKDQTCKEIGLLDSKENELNKLVTEIDGRREALRKIKNTLDELLSE